MNFCFYEKLNVLKNLFSVSLYPVGIYENESVVGVKKLGALSRTSLEPLLSVHEEN